MVLRGNSKGTCLPSQDVISFDYSAGLGCDSRPPLGVTIMLAGDIDIKALRIEAQSQVSFPHRGGRIALRLQSLGYGHKTIGQIGGVFCH